MPLAEVAAKRKLAKRTSLIRANFLAQFQRYIQAGHSLKDTAGLLGICRTTVYRTYRGYTFPSLKEIQRICNQLGWDFDNLASPAFQLDKEFAHQRLNFDQLKLRALSRQRAQDPSGLQCILSTSAALLQARLQYAQIVCVLYIDANFKMRLLLTNPVFSDYHVAVVMQQGDLGPGITLVYTEQFEADYKARGEKAPAVTFPLTEEGFGGLLRLLRKTLNGKNTTQNSESYSGASVGRDAASVRKTTARVEST